MNMEDRGNIDRETR